MRVLVIKTSSLGDVIHTFPALTDAANAIPGITFDWVVEESLQELPLMHPNVASVIPVAIRRWRKAFWQPKVINEMRAFLNQLRQTTYDIVIDAQGLLKSSVISRAAKGQRYGLDCQSAREPLSAWAYQKRIRVPWGQHAVSRVRTLFAQTLDYAYADTEMPRYGIRCPEPTTSNMAQNAIFLLHGTTWRTKCWPEAYWGELAQLIHQSGYRPMATWGNDEEKRRANAIKTIEPNALILPKASLTETATRLQSAKAIVAVDTGLGHLACALGKPTLSLYGATDPEQTGTLGHHQQHLVPSIDCAPCLSKRCQYTPESHSCFPPCFAPMTPSVVWHALKKLMEASPCN